MPDNQIAIPWRALVQREEPELRSRTGQWPPPKPRWKQAKDWIDNEVLSRIPWWARFVAPIPENTDDWVGWADAATSALPQKTAAKLSMLPLLALRSPRARRILHDFLGFKLDRPVDMVRVQVVPPERHEGKLVFPGSPIRNAVFGVPVRHNNVREAIEKAVALSGAPPEYVLRGRTYLRNPLIVGETGVMADVLGKVDKDADLSLDLVRMASQLGDAGNPASFTWDDVVRWMYQGLEKVPPSERLEALENMDAVARTIKQIRGRNFVARKYAEAFQHPESQGSMARTLGLVLPDPLVARRTWHAGFDAVIPVNANLIGTPSEIALKPDWSHVIKLVDERGKEVLKDGKPVYIRKIGRLMGD